MRVLLDACVWSGAKAQLSQLGFDVIWVGELGEGLDDVSVLKLAAEQERILVTLDKDFGKLSIYTGMSHCGILRLVEIPPKEHAAVTARLVQQHGEELLNGAMLVVKGTKIRLRKPPRGK